MHGIPEQLILILLVAQSRRNATAMLWNFTILLLMRAYQARNTLSLLARAPTLLLGVQRFNI